VCFLICGFWKGVYALYKVKYHIDVNIILFRSLQITQDLFLYANCNYMINICGLVLGTVHHRKKLISEYFSLYAICAHQLYVIWNFMF
jgi:hypothetical protein